jgi:hypothetical protein
VTADGSHRGGRGRFPWPFGRVKYPAAPPAEVWSMTPESAARRRSSRLAGPALIAVAGGVLGALLLAGCGAPAPDPPPGSPPPSGVPSAFPSPFTTGWAPTGVTLHPYTGPNPVTTKGTVIDGADISSELEIKASNVTITRSRIAAGGGASYVVLQSSGSGLMITDTEITAKSGQVADRAVASFGTNMTLTRVYVHGTQRGIQTGDGTTITASYSDDFNNASGNHATGVMALGGTNHVVLKANTFGCGTGECSAAMSVYPETDFGGANDDWTVNGNLFNGGSYCVYLGYSPADGESPNTNIRFTNNRFGTKYHAQCGIYGPVGSWSSATGDVWSGNVWYAPGTALDGQPVAAG